MRVIVAAPSPVPLRTGGAERLWNGLTAALASAGHTVDLVKLPVREHRLVDLVTAYEQFSALDLSHADMVITGKYPAWMVEHPRHVVWMLHPLRGLYDTYPTAAMIDMRPPDCAEARRLLALCDDTGDVAPDALFDAVFALADTIGDHHEALSVPSPVARAVIHRLDRIALDRRRVHRHAAISGTVAARAGYFAGEVDAQVVFPPLAMRPPDGADDAAQQRDLILTVSRLEVPKRVDLVIAAHRRSAGRTPLVIVGTGGDEPRLRRLADGDERIRFAGEVNDDELSALYRRARAVVFTPRDEDYGYIALEAMAHGAPVITTTDAGGPSELVLAGRTGLVVAPDPTALGEAIDLLDHDRDLVERLGSDARAQSATITWEATLETLLEPAGDRRRRSDRRRVTVLSTYPLHHQHTGGQMRALALCEAVSRHNRCDVEIISTSTTDGPTRCHLGPHISEIVVPLSRRHHLAETDLRLVTGDVSLTDVAVSMMWRATPALRREIGASLARADAVIAAHPYLGVAAVELTPELPLACDEHNHESLLKRAIYPDDEAGRWLLDKVTEVEARVLRHAALITATTADDLATLRRTYRIADAPAMVVPNGVDTASVAFVTGAERRRRRRALVEQMAFGATESIALFVGSGHGPNIDAGRALVAAAATMPEVTLLLAGRHSEVLDPGGAPRNVHLLGELDDRGLRDLLASCDVGLNPMDSGGGSNLKLLTYLAAGLPVVSTEIGARGIDADAAGIVLCTNSELATAMVAAVADGDERAAAGRRYVEEHADWQVIGARYAALVEEHLLK